MSTIQSIISLTIFLRLVLLNNLPVFAEQINMNQQSITAYVIDSPIKLDGLLNEPAWKSAELITGFTQKEPREGTPATEKTEVRILYDEDNLYVGVICFDSEPEKIIYKDLKRDSGLTSDDKFTFILDTYYDKRMGYYFSTNPNGVRYDATFMSDMGQNSDWDEIWDVSARIMDYGWSCEFVIPFKSLRFPAKETQIWGINFLREIRRKHESVLWRSWRRNEGVRHLSQAGTLLMTGPLHRGKQINFKPYLLSGAEKLLNKDIDNVFKYGLDVKIGITSNTTIDLTTNTDFAHIESDRDVINLTRFDIYYPEKRDFFLEGSETFDFTQGGTRLFYSRRIGISPDRQELPIMGGVKLTQKTGTYRLGMLSMQTKEKHGYPGTNYSVIRVKKDVLEQSYVGFIVTSVFDAGHHDNQVYGMDWGYKTDKLFTNRNFEIQGYITGSVNDGSDVDNLAGRIYISYPNDFINLYTLYHALDDNFKPGVGFVRRVGIKNYMWNMSINPRPSIPFIQKLVFIPCNLNYNTDMDGKLVARIVDIRPFGFTTLANDGFQFNYHNEYDYVEKEFTMFDDVIVPQGVYDWWFYDMGFHSNTSRVLSLSASTRWGDYYNGSRTSYQGSITFKTNAYYSLSTDATYNDITIAQKGFITKEYGGRLTVDFSTRLSTSTFVQWNNQTKEIITNFRLHYIPKIGSDLYLVYNHLLDEEHDFQTIQNTGALKIDYNIRF